MGEREDILRRALERVNTGPKSMWQTIAARDALAEAAACPPDDAQQRLDQIAELLEPYASDVAPDGYSRIVDALRLARREAVS